MRTELALLIAVLALRGPVSAQQPAAVRTAGVAQAAAVPAPPSPAQAQAQNPFLGGVPSGAATSQELPLSLIDAIQRGLKFNLGVTLAGQAAQEARGLRLVSLSRLRPQVNARVSGASQQINLAAFGFSGFQGVGPIVGPFSLVDARASADGPILDFRAIEAWRANSEAERAAALAAQDARDFVVQVVTNLYLQAIAGAARIDAAKAQFATAQALYNQAVDFQKTGVAAGIDVLRAQVELRAQQQRVIFVENEFEKQKLSIARAIGLPDGQPFRLTDAAPYSPPPTIGLEEALQRSLAARMDYQSALARVRAAEANRRAAMAGFFPSLGFQADYGAIGPRFNGSHGTYTAALALAIPIFQGGRVRGEVLQAGAELDRSNAELGDLRSRIAFEVRTALLDLNAAGAQVDVARDAVGLAGQQVTQSRDRFAAGVTNNVEVVQAQQALATAHENYIASLYEYNAAKAALARAVGGGEEAIRTFLIGGK